VHCPARHAYIPAGLFLLNGILWILTGTAVLISQDTGNDGDLLP
jgi:hypothetical protein